MGSGLCDRVGVLTVLSTCPGWRGSVAEAYGITDRPRHPPVQIFYGVGWDTKNMGLHWMNLFLSIVSELSDALTPYLAEGAEGIPLSLSKAALPWFVSESSPLNAWYQELGHFCSCWTTGTVSFWVLLSSVIERFESKMDWSWPWVAQKVKKV